MRNIFKTILCLTAVCSVCAGHSAQAQTRKHSLSANWGMAIPVGDNYIDKVSGANLSLEWNYRVLPVLSAGVSIGYGRSTDNGVGDEYFNSMLVSGYREKKLKTTPLMARFDYFPMGNDATLFRPYVGVGVGVQYAKFQFSGDTYATEGTKTWAESFSARVGTRIFPTKTGRVFLDAKCAWNYAGNGWPAAEVKSIQHIGATIGVGILF